MKEKKVVYITMPTVDTYCTVTVAGQVLDLTDENTTYHHRMEDVGNLDVDENNVHDIDSIPGFRYKDRGFPSALQAFAVDHELAEFTPEGVKGSKVPGLGLVSSLLARNNGKNGGTLKSLPNALPSLIRDETDLIHLGAEHREALHLEPVIDRNAELNRLMRRYLRHARTIFAFLAEGGDCFPAPRPTREELKERQEGGEKRDWGKLSGALASFKERHPQIVENLRITEFFLAKPESMFSLGGYLVMLHILGEDDAVVGELVYWQGRFSMRSLYKDYLKAQARKLFWDLVDGIDSQNHVFGTRHGAGLTIHTDLKIAKQVWELVNVNRYKRAKKGKKPPLTGLAARALEVLQDCPGVKHISSLANKLNYDIGEFDRIVDKYVKDRDKRLRLERLADLAEARPVIMLVVKSDNHMIMQVNYGSDLNLAKVADVLNDVDNADWHYETRHGHDMVMTASGKVNDSKPPSSLDVRNVEGVIDEYAAFAAAA